MLYKTDNKTGMIAGKYNAPPDIIFKNHINVLFEYLEKTILEDDDKLFKLY